MAITPFFLFQISNRYQPIYRVPIRKTSQITDGTHLEQPSVRKIGQITDGEPVLSVASILAMICIKMVRVQRYEKGFQGNGPNTQASCSKQAVQAKPKGLLRLLCAGRRKMQNNRLFTLSQIYSYIPKR